MIPTTTLLQALVDRIEAMAFGRIRDLRVLVVGDELILEGRARTQHAKQLAHEAALGLVTGHPRLANRILVG